MCGIYGIFNFSSTAVQPDQMPAMGAVTIHRGPDDEGAHVDGNCAIGMRRLSIIDLQGGHQPISNSDDTIWLVCNGEIYNFRELRDELRRLGHDFKTQSDSEVVLHAYAEYGDSFVEKLSGMFAFAIWDARKRRLLVGRDRLGIKPLYYLNDGTRFAFASEAKALLELPGVTARVDSAALKAYLELGYVPAPLSMFAGINKLTIGSVIEITKDGTKTRTYWRPNGIIDPNRSAADWAAQIRDGIGEAVRTQMVSDVPIGAFLSGGIDSSAVLAFMARHSKEPVKTYSIGFEGNSAESFYSELPFARKVAHSFDTDHHEIIVKPDVISLIPRLLWHMDEPIADSAFVTTYLVAEFARRDVTVILSGVGGDELFGGYRRYLGERYAGIARKVPQPLRHAARSVAQWLPSDRHSRISNLARYARSFLSSVDLSFEERYRSYVGVFDPHEVEAMLANPAGTRHDAIALAFDSADGDDPLSRMFAVDAQTQLPDDLLLLTDKMTMATSLECRVPLLDHELVELAMQIPSGIKVGRGELKHVMKLALADLLPPDILNRPKRGFGAPMGAWMKAELLPLITSLLSREAVESRGLIRYDSVSRLIEDHRRSRIDGTDKLLALLNLEVWSRIFIDGNQAADVTDELQQSVA